MKIKFLKEYRAIPLSGGIDNNWGVEKDEVKYVHDENGQWFIDNGFAEKIDDTKGGWRPEEDDTYYYVRDTMNMFMRDEVARCSWIEDDDDEYRYSIGNVFKTLESARRFIDYLKAVETVRHDEGFMTRSENGSGWAICLKDDGRLGATVINNKVASAFCFEWNDDAEASIEKHPNEWQTILNYDWSKE